MLAFPSYNYEGYFKLEQVVELKSAYAVCPDHIFALFHLPLLAASLIILFYHFCILSSFPKTGPKTKFSKSHHLQVPNPLSQKQFPGAGNPHKSSIHKNLSSQKGLPEIPFLFFTMSFRTLF